MSKLIPRFANIRCSRLRLMFFSVALLCVVTMGYVSRSHAQTFTVIHEFQGPEGWQPESGLTVDAAGNLYGTTYYATGQQGTVYQMKPASGGWQFDTLYYFSAYDAPQNGYFLDSSVVFGPGGALYGTTSAGGVSEWCLGGCGVFYVLRPPRTICRSSLCLWTESVP